jgi:hypothetical protein
MESSTPVPAPFWNTGAEYYLKRPRRPVRPREARIHFLRARGLGFREIAHRLGITSERTRQIYMRACRVHNWVPNGRVFQELKERYLGSFEESLAADLATVQFNAINWRRGTSAADSRAPQPEEGSNGN